MKSLLTLKTLTGFLTAGTMVVGIKAVQDTNFNSNDFMNQTKVESIQRLDDQSVVRYVASTTAARPAVQYLPKNEINSLMIDGEWEVRRIQNEKNEVVFEAQDSQDYLPMEFSLIGTSLVRVGTEEEMDFRVSYLDESGRTIAIFRQFGKGYEILEAVRIVKNEVEVTTNEKSVELVENKEDKNTTGVVIEDVQDLVLERVLHPTKDPNILVGNVVSGSVVLDSEMIEELSVVVGVGKNYEQQLSFIGGAEIKAGGQFSAETNDGEVTGIITNNGKDGYRIRFATGPLQGAMLNFVTEEKFEAMAEQEEEARIAREETQELTSDQIEVVENQNDAQSFRSASAEENNIYEISEEEVEEEEIIEPETEEEFARITEETGFDFTQSVRAPASK